MTFFPDGFIQCFSQELEKENLVFKDFKGQQGQTIKILCVCGEGGIVPKCRC